MGTTARKGVTTDASALMAHLHDYSIVLGKDMATVIREQAVLFCSDMVRFSRPFAGKSPGTGNTSDAKKAGADNVARSIRKIFRPVELADKEQIASLGRYDVFKMWAKRKGETIQGKGKMLRWDAFQKKFGKGTNYAFIGPGDLGGMARIHNANRTDNGHGSLTSSARGSKHPFAIVAKDSDIKKYIRQKQEDVGILKSAYFFAAKRMKGQTPKAPTWAQHAEGQPNAVGQDDGDKPMRPEVLVGNLIGKRAGNDRFVALAISYRAYAMRVKMAAELNKKKIPLWLATAKGMTTGTSKYF